MKCLTIAATLFLMALGLTLPLTASAADSGSAPEQRRSEDAVCTKCHDESESKPILAIA